MSVNSEFSLSDHEFIVNSIKSSKFKWVVLSLMILLEAFLFLIIPYTLKVLIDEVIILGNHSIIMTVSLVLVSVNILQYITNIAVNLIRAHYCNESDIVLKDQLLKSLLNKHLEFYDKFETGRILTTYYQDLGTVNKYIRVTLPQLFKDLVMLVGVIIILFGLDVKLTILMLIIQTLIVAFNNFIKRYIHENQSQLMQESGKLNSITVERVQAVRDIQMFGFQDLTIKSVREQLKNYYKYAFKSSALSDSASAITNMFLMMGTIFIFLYGAIAINNEVSTIGTIIGYSSYYARLYQPISSIRKMNEEFTKYSVSKSRINELMMAYNPSYANYDIEHINSIKFENVVFSYKTREDSVLNNVTFNISKGEKVAILGPSGSGKTTILDTIGGFYLHDSGEVKINDISISEIDLNSLRNRISFIPQNPLLFNLSIKQNICLDPNETDRQFKNAVDLAELNELINRIPNSENTIIGELGNSLSGGERQRISIGRASTKPCDVLLVDELATGLDESLRYRILENILRAFTEQAIVYVTHNYEDVKYFDRVINLGDIVEENNTSQYESTR